MPDYSRCVLKFALCMTTGVLCITTTPCYSVQKCQIEATAQDQDILTLWHIYILCEYFQLNNL